MLQRIGFPICFLFDAFVCLFLFRLPVIYFGFIVDLTGELESNVRNVGHFSSSSVHSVQNTKESADIPDISARIPQWKMMKTIVSPPIPVLKQSPKNLSFNKPSIRWFRLRLIVNPQLLEWCWITHAACLAQFNIEMKRFDEIRLGLIQLKWFFRWK